MIERARPRAARRRAAALAAAALLGVGLSGCTSPGSLIHKEGSADAPRIVDTAALDGCREVEPGVPDDREHLDAATAGPPSELYPVPLPARGPHYGAWLGPHPGFADVALDVRSVLHNLEHGAIAVWVRPDRVTSREGKAIDVWQRGLAAVGFVTADLGANIYASPMPEGLEVDAAVAYRAWGIAVDCDTWSVAQADAFVAQYYGSRGDAPEAQFGPYPDDNGVIVGPPGFRSEGTTTA